MTDILCPAALEQLHPFGTCVKSFLTQRQTNIQFCLHCLFKLSSFPCPFCNPERAAGEMLTQRNLMSCFVTLAMAAIPYPSRSARSSLAKKSSTLLFTHHFSGYYLRYTGAPIPLCMAWVSTLVYIVPNYRILSHHKKTPKEDKKVYLSSIRLSLHYLSFH